MFSFVGLCSPCIPCTSQDDLHYRGNIGHHSIFLLVALVCQVVIFGVPISYTVCALSNVTFVFGWFEFYFALLYICH
jgi:hypothetical protein